MSLEDKILFDDLPVSLDLAEDEIHIFCGVLDLARPRLEQRARLLSSEERQRAAQFYFPKDRDLYIAGRALLREILGWALRAEPKALSFSYGPQGKPQLAGPVPGHSLHFNASHCELLALYAVSLTHEVGIDLERIRPVPEAGEIVEDFFHEREREKWLALPENKRTEGFFDCWTRKEAFLKATGEGIGGKTDESDVWSDTGLWSFWSIKPAAGYAAAVAAKASSQNTHVRCWKWPRQMPIPSRPNDASLAAK